MIESDVTAETQKATRLSVDWVVLVAALALIGIGLIMGMSTSSVVGYRLHQDSFLFMRRQVIFLVIGFLGMIGAYLAPMRVHKLGAMIGFVGSMGLLLATLIPGVGVTLGGATRWISMGFIQLQPIELVKFFLCGVLAQVLVNKGATMGRLRTGILPVLLVIAVPVGILAKQPDLGNIILIGIVSMVMLFLADTRGRHLVGLAIAGLGMVAGSILVNPYQQQRILSFLNPWEDPLGRNYHIVQSLTAIGSGGFWGLGLGQSKLKYFYLPLHYSDFIFAVLCEEGGFLLGTIVIGLFAVVLYRVMMRVRWVTDPVVQLYVVGLTLYLVVQAFLNIGVVIGVLPVTGIPLTFISFGGTSLVMAMVSVGAILRGGMN